MDFDHLGCLHVVFQFLHFYIADEAAFGAAEGFGLRLFLPLEETAVGEGVTTRQPDGLLEDVLTDFTGDEMCY